jgi:hypothetical protein
LQVLAENREQILLAELGALLHDIGKLSSLFLDQMSRYPTSNSAGFEHARAIRKIPNFVEQQFVSSLGSPAVSRSLHMDHVDKHKQLGEFLDLILHHDRKRHSAFLVRLLHRCDGMDSGADKGTEGEEGLPSAGKQELDNTRIATAFGAELRRIDPGSLDQRRIALSRELGKDIDSMCAGTQAEGIRSKILKLLSESYGCALGETRRAANDVTLWDHSFSTATLYKTALASLLVSGSLDIDQPCWRLLRVNFDVLGLYARSIRIADLLGYREKVDCACEALKQVVECEYPLGNELYRDTTGIYFTFPDVDLPADLEDLIRRTVEQIEPELAPRIRVGGAEGDTAGKQLKRLLAEQHEKARQELSRPTTFENLTPRWQQEWDERAGTGCEVCPVCRLRPMQENAEACDSCLSRRQSRIEAWTQDPHKTVWMDEIADNNGRVALIVGKFGLDKWLSGELVETLLVSAAQNGPEKCRPKNPSPARLRRVWETTQRFWEESEQMATELLPSRSRWLLTPTEAPPREMPDRAVCDGTLNGQPISVWRSGDRLLTISNVGDRPRPGMLRVSWGEGHRKKPWPCSIESVDLAGGDPGSYSPFLSLLASPDQFLALCPADNALEFLAGIHQKYREEFGKVQNRLPLFLGLVFFRRKLPLAAVMDTARRMLGEVPLGEEKWAVTQAQDGELTFDNQVQWTVPTTMGDGSGDVWYPYFYYVGDPGERDLRFQANNRWLVHVSNLRGDDKVEVMPSRFSYVFLEHTAQRFRFDPSETLLLDELPRVTAMWDRIKQSEMTDTALRGVSGLLETKAAAWGKHADEFRRLTETTLKHAGLWNQQNSESAVTPEDVISGRFEYCLDLYLHILKRRVKEDQHDSASV